MLQLYLQSISLFDYGKVEGRYFLWPSDPQAHKRSMFCGIYDRHGEFLAIICLSHTKLSRKSKSGKLPGVGGRHALQVQRLGVKMSIKENYLFNHLDCFPANLGDLSEEQRERFHQDIKIMEERYESRWDAHMMADYCWSLQRDSVTSHSRKSYKRKFVTID